MSNASQSMGAERFLESKGLEAYARRIVEVTEAHTVEDLKMLDPTMVEDVIHICQMKMISAKKFRLAIEEVKEQPSAAAQAQHLAQPVVASAPPPSAPPAQAMPAPYAAPPTQPAQAIPVQAVAVQAIPVQAMPVQPACAQVSSDRPANYTPAIGVYPQQKKSDNVGMGAALAGGAAALLGGAVAGIMLGEAIEHSHHHHHRHHHRRHRDIFEVDFGFGGHHRHGRHHHHHHRW